MTDNYTKAVLTVIAVSLAVIAARPFWSEAHAQAPTSVRIDSVSEFAFQYATVPVRMRQ